MQLRVLEALVKFEIDFHIFNAKNSDWLQVEFRLIENWSWNIVFLAGLQLCLGNRLTYMQQDVSKRN